MDDTAATPSIGGTIASTFPPLDPNGRPFSMALRGAAADLEKLRSALTSCPADALSRLELKLQESNTKDLEGNVFGDVDEEVMPHFDQPQAAEQVGGCHDGHQVGHELGGDTIDDGKIDEVKGIKKRGREGDDDDEGAMDCAEEGDDDVDTMKETLLSYHPSVRCTCSSWKMEGVRGDLLVTSLRLLFLAEKQDGDGYATDDVVIDGGCIALHAVDSSGGDKASASHHVYCQLAELTEDDGDAGYASATNMMPTMQIGGEEEDSDIVNEDEQRLGKEGSSEVEDTTIELYFEPAADGSESQSSKCQVIFDSLSKLATLNPAGDSDVGFNGGGGLFSMLSLMAGIDGGGGGFGGEMMVANHNETDDMVVRLGDGTNSGNSNNLVEHDDDSEGAPDEERQAMLCRFDEMLVVPPEYEIASSEDGQFDDAEEDNEDDNIL